MWVFLNNSFLSIVDETAAARHTRARGTTLLVRARRKGDIEAVFPGAIVQVTPGRDYRFRSVMQRGVVEDAMVKAVNAIDYGNFKNTVIEDERHDAYLACWVAMDRYQRGGFARPARPAQAAMQKELRYGDFDDDDFGDLLPPEKPLPKAKPGRRKR